MDTLIERRGLHDPTSAVIDSSKEEAIPPIRADSPSTNPDNRESPLSFEEQPTQAIDPEMAASLLDAPPEPPVRTGTAKTIQEKSVSPIERAAPPIRRPSETPSVTQEPTPNEPPARPFDAESLLDARARSAAQVRSAQEHAEKAVREAEVQRQKDDDDAYHKAQGAQAAAIQITADGNTRVIQQSIAVGEAEHDDLKEPPARTSQSTGSGSLQVDVLVPVVEVEEDLHLPELTDSAAPFANAQELQIKEHPLTGMLAGFLDDAQDAETRGDLPGAIQSYGDALDVDEGLENAWLGRGRCRIELGDYAAALSDLRRAQALSNGSTAAILEMGHLFYARKDYQRAIHYYGEVLDTEPSNAEAVGRRGLCHHYLGERERALTDLRKAVEHPEMSHFQQGLQMILQTQS